jgi:hypothetical protein
MYYQPAAGVVVGVLAAPNEKPPPGLAATCQNKQVNNN